MQIYFVASEKNEGSSVGGLLRAQGISLALVRSLKYIDDGITLNGVRARTNMLLKTGDKVGITLPPPSEFSALPQDIDIDVLYQSADAMVVNKPAGMATHTGPSHPCNTLANAFCGLLHKSGANGGTFRPIGRLDAYTSGLVLCAMNAAAAPLLARSMRKSYLALATGCVAQPQGVINSPLAAAPNSAIMQQVDPNGRSAVTHYTCLATTKTASLLQLTLQTGRTHQIRVHMASIGHPLLGDELYGGSRSLIARHALHSAQLSFGQLQAAPVTLKADMPQDMRQAAQAADIDLSDFTFCS